MDFKHDKRLTQRNIRKGILSHDEHKQHLASLPDLKDDALKVEAQLEDTYGKEDELPKEEEV